MKFYSEFYKGKKVLITGHTGFKGAWMCRILELAGANVTGFALEAPTNPSLFDLCHIADNMNYNLTDPYEIAKFIKRYLLIFSQK